jgi:hypothetical protein
VQFAALANANATHRRKRMSDLAAVLPLPAEHVPLQNSGENRSTRYTLGNPHRWQKGMPSPNPGGRPRKLAVSSALEELLLEPLPNDREGKRIRRRYHLPEGSTWADAVAASLIRRAMRSNAAIAEIFDRIEGKARQRVELQAAEDITITVIHEKRALAADY